MNRLLSCLLVSALTLPSIATATPHLSGTVTAGWSDGQEHLGLWEYTIQLEWELPASPIASLEIRLPLDNCECSCEENLFRFGNPSGSMIGSNATLPCTQDLLGSYLCGSDTPDGRGVLRFVTLESEGWRTGIVGNGVLTVFSILGPGLEDTVAAISTRSAGTSVSGRLTGAMPFCDRTTCAALPIEARTWSLIKTVYR